MQKKHLLVICMLLLSGTAAAQEQAPKKKRIGYEQMTQIMTKDLKLDEKQQKKVAKLNKKYKTLIEGEERKAPDGNRPPMGERPSGAPGGGFGGGPDGGFGGGMPGGGSFGGGMPGGGFGGGPRGGGMPGGQSQEKSYDFDKNQKKYDKAIGKILSSEQMDGYQQIKPKFASQRRVREFLLGGPQEFKRNGENQ
jgi:hypothetical protein